MLRTTGRKNHFSGWRKSRGGIFFEIHDGSFLEGLSSGSLIEWCQKGSAAELTFTLSLTFCHSFLSSVVSKSQTLPNFWSNSEDNIFSGIMFY